MISTSGVGGSGKQLMNLSMEGIQGKWLLSKLR